MQGLEFRNRLKELMLVRSDLIFIEKETNNPATFTVSFQSTVDSLEGEDLTYSNFMNLTCKESSIKDFEAIRPVLEFHEECPRINNLLSLSYRIRNMTHQEKIRYRRGLLDGSLVEEVGAELAIAI